MGRLIDRPTGEIIVLFIGITICVVVLMTVAGITVSEVLNPELDTTGAFSLVSDIVNTLIGVMAGFLAGKTQSRQSDAA